MGTEVDEVTRVEEVTRALLAIENPASVSFDLYLSVSFDPAAGLELRVVSAGGVSVNVSVGAFKKDPILGFGEGGDEHGWTRFPIAIT